MPKADKLTEIRPANDKPASLINGKKKRGNRLDRLLKTFQSDLAKDPELKRRIETHFDDFWNAYSAVYQTEKHLEKRVVSIMEEIIRSAINRPAYLQQLDLKREKRPNWFQTEQVVGAMLYVDLFSLNLRGLRDRIDYLKELGVNFLHLMPLLKARDGLNDGGYAVEDFRQVEPRFGTIEDLIKITRELHKEGISVVLDFVMNHTAREHRWAQEAMHGNKKYQKYFVMLDTRAEVDEYEDHLIEVFPDFAPGSFTYYHEVDKWVWTTFYDFQWDLNYSNPDVFESMMAELLFLANVGIDVFRLDAVPYIWKRKGTVCQNEPEAHLIVRALRALARMAAPSVIFIAEAIVSPDQIVEYLGIGGHEGKECDLAYNATLMCHLWHALACENTHLLRTTLSSLPIAPKESSWLNYIRSHDDIGWGISDDNAAAVQQNGYHTRMYCTDFYSGEIKGSYALGYPFQRDYWSGEARISGTAAALSGLQKSQVNADEIGEDDAISRLLLLYNVISSWNGIPLIYMGDEVGQLNQYNYLADINKHRDNRWVHRSPMPWEKAMLRSVHGTVEYRLFNGIRNLIKARKRSNVLDGRSTDRVIIIDRDAVFAFERVYAGDKMLMLSNFSKSSTHIPMDHLPAEWRGEWYHDMVRNATLHFTTGEILLEPYGYLWLKKAGKPAGTGLAPTYINLIAETVPGETFIC
jgi:amylosucrase